MALITENGWPQIPSSELDRSEVPGLSIRIETAPGDVSTILRAWMIWYDRNVEDIEENFLPRDEWGWSATNTVWNSNHLSGTAVDINATMYPWKQYTMDQPKVDRIQEGLRLFEGKVFWGRAWTGSPDEMHYQIQGNAEQIAPFAERLRQGYLGLFEPEKPKDPKDFPLPEGYAYGPLDGPVWSISGEYAADSQAAKDGLGRWQEAVGIPVTKVWDARTKAVATQLQVERGWPDTPNLGRGLIYRGEWDAVMRDGWKPGAVLDPYGIYWADVSMYQGLPVDESYGEQYDCISFRVCTGNEIDDKAEANYEAAIRLANAGLIDVIMPYFFWRPEPDHQTEKTFRDWMDAHGWHARVAVLADVESGKGSKLGEVSGDQSTAVNAILERLVAERFNGETRRVRGYHNVVADPNLWQTLPPWLLMIRPHYGIQPGKNRPAGSQFWAHQYTSTAQDIPPWQGRNVDMNFFPGTKSQFLTSFGMGEDTKPTLPSPPVDDGPPAPPFNGDLAELILRQFEA